MGAGPKPSDALCQEERRAGREAGAAELLAANKVNLACVVLVETPS